MSTTYSRELLTVKEAAEYLGTSERFPRRLVEQRAVPVYKVGRFVRFDRADLDAYLESRVRAARED